jgi:hypothetical protein
MTSNRAAQAEAAPTNASTVGGDVRVFVAYPGQDDG